MLIATLYIVLWLWIFHTYHVVPFTSNYWTVDDLIFRRLGLEGHFVVSIKPREFFLRFREQRIIISTRDQIILLKKIDDYRDEE